jgi:hypothetical protein
MNSLEPVLAHKVFVASSLILVRKLSFKINQLLKNNEIVLLTIFIFILFDMAIIILQSFLIKPSKHKQFIRENEIIRVARFFQQITLLFVTLQIQRILLIQGDDIGTNVVGNLLMAIFVSVGVHVFRKESEGVMGNILYLFSDMFAFLLPLIGGLMCVHLGVIVIITCEYFTKKVHFSFIISFVIQLCDIAARNIVFAGLDSLIVDDHFVEIIQCLLIIALLQKITSTDYFAFVTAIKIFTLYGDKLWAVFLVLACFLNNDDVFFVTSLNYIKMCIAGVVNYVDIAFIPSVMLFFYYLDELTQGVLSTHKNN